MKRFSVVLVSLGLCVAVWCFYHNKTQNNTAHSRQNVANNTQPTYESNHLLSKVYTLDGRINYQIDADTLQYFQTANETLFEKPVMILFDPTLTPSWRVSSKHAKLDGVNNILYLSGNVKIRNLTDDIELKEVNTETIQLNLTTRDIWSNDKVMLKGDNFASEGNRLEGNLTQKLAKLINNVKTYYEIQNESK